MNIPFFYDYTCRHGLISAAHGSRPTSTAREQTIDFRPVYLKHMKEPMIGPEPAGERSYGPRKTRYYANLRSNWRNVAVLSSATRRNSSAPIRRCC